MSTRFRPVFFLACAFMVAHSPLVAQAVADASIERTLEELDAFIAAQPKWSTSASIWAGYGYKDNLLLSFAGEERSPFFRGGVDLLILRMRPDRFEYSVFAEAEGTRYTEGKTVNQDAKVWIQTEPAYRIADTLKVGLPLTGYYYDQVFDVSDTEVERLVAELKVQGVMFGPSIRWDFHPAGWVEAQAVGQRKRYDDRANDGDIGEGIMRLGWVRGPLEVRLTGMQRWRDFETRAQYSSAGRELLGTELKISEREGEIRFDVAWDADGRWETSTRLSLLHYRDNGSGYFNYREQKIGQEVEWNGAPWLVRVGGTASRIDFGVQTVGLGIDPPSRVKDEYSGELLVERRLSNRWAVFGRYYWERSRSNDPVASYSVNEGLLGLRLSWEK